ncbi:carbamoyltransferase HypF [Parathalassolituus penaei]|uniref:Carbamoyltransferase HypF n=1 Tax=Parathalassolituus penaei TaxID=2997323 RepID=A0A9X3IS22_9GAMM|nr:carbamoyltransferase HypF [Parathalassolituus penaei]MCY0964835.1 carbamoyltransferase HypF [Parathalassolituus penaei]
MAPQRCQPDHLGPLQGWRLRISGQVQGVGFRPFVYRLMTAAGLSGRVFNDAGTVVLETLIRESQLAGLIRDLQRQAPALANIRDIVSQQAPELLDILAPGFVIAGSPHPLGASIDVTVDTAPCVDCIADIRDVSNRRYHYPFTNCTQCGPRYTLIRQLPYDRPNTSMAAFAQCPACLAEYSNPADRRFHAQPNACPVCGPQLTLVERDGTERFAQPEAGGSDALLIRVLKQLREGKVVAIKGVGGFHLACDARQPLAIQRLRQRKQRPTKPLAVMVADADQARCWGHFNAAASAWLVSPQAPVVVVPQAHAARIFHTDALNQLAPGLDALGLMLPQSPLHRLLFDLAAQQLDDPDLALVMTSANRSGEPLMIDNQVALDGLADIADLWLLHNREILVRNDDAVINAMTSQPLLQRCGRGLAPLSLHLAAPASLPSVLALGSYLKNSIALNHQQLACLSQHIGDLDHPDNCRALDDSWQHWLPLLNVKPAAVATDLHPQGYGADLAQQLAAQWQVPLVQVPHHQAHIAAVLADQGWPFNDAVAGLALDGFGLGWDGHSRGGELLVLEGPEFRHLGSLASLPQPGADSASREPWRMAAGLLLTLGYAPAQIRQHLQVPSDMALTMLERQWQRGLNCPQTTSGGRWFDALAGILGMCTDQHFRQTYEGEAAMRLESLARDYLREHGEPALLLPHLPESQSANLDLYPLLQLLAERYWAGMPAGQVAALFHVQLVSWLGQWLLRHFDLDPLLPPALVLAGGCFQNSLLRQQLADWLEQHGIRALLPRRLPVNDGGLAIGQLWVASQRLQESGNQQSDP